MDDALAPILNNDILQDTNVLILVVMDDALAHMKFSRGLR